MKYVVLKFGFGIQLSADNGFYLVIPNKVVIFPLLELCTTGKYLNLKLQCKKLQIKTQGVEMHLIYFPFRIVAAKTFCKHIYILDNLYWQYALGFFLIVTIIIFFLSCWSGTTTVLQFPVNSCVRDGRPPQIMTLISFTPVTWPQWPLYKSWNVWVYLWKT